GLPASHFDLVILNSIVQCFPNVEYLRRVLSQIIPLVAPGGCIFLGDIRSEPLLETFHTSLQLHKAPDSLPIAELRERIKHGVALERDVALAPGWFIALQERSPAISWVEITPKRGHARNELTGYRFDAILHVGPPPRHQTIPAWLDWKAERLTFDKIR